MKQTFIATTFLTAVLGGACLGVACNGTPLPTSPTTVTETTATSAPATSATGVAAACATADGVNDACACDADAHSYCAGFYSADWESYARANGYTTASWKYGLLDCLNKQPVTAACTASLDRRELLNTQMMSACAAYCRGTSPKPGAEPCVDHLKSIYNALDNACRRALDAHEAAKPLGGNGPF